MYWKSKNVKRTVTLKSYMKYIIKKIIRKSVILEIHKNNFLRDIQQKILLILVCKKPKPYT